MRIQHNILAMNAYRNYSNNTSALGKNLERLSSGYKINRAGDDAAGLAISEKMRAQITGLDAAQKNVKDGVSLVKTAEGAMQEIQDMLNRMAYLATQSANGTYDSSVDRTNLQKEVDALRSEINRIADSANFNGINLLDGSQAGVKAQAAYDEIINGASFSGEERILKSNLTGKPLVNNALETVFDAYAKDGQTGKFSVDFSKINFNITSNTTASGSFSSGSWAMADLTVTIGDLSFKVKAQHFGSSVKISTGSNGKIDKDKLSTFKTNLQNAIGSAVFTALKEKMGIASGSSVRVTMNGVDWIVKMSSDKKGLQFEQVNIPQNADEARLNFTVSVKEGSLTNAGSKKVKIEMIESMQDGVKVDSEAIPAGAKRLAETHFEVKESDIVDGAKITLGDTSFVIKLGADSKVKASGAGEKLIDMSNYEYGDLGLLNIALSKISQQAGTVKLTNKDGKQADFILRVTDYGLSVLRSSYIQKSDATDAFKTWDDFIGNFGVEYDDVTIQHDEVYGKGGLMLQIGDTSDDYNQLRVNIGDMHVGAMGFELDSKGNITNHGTSIANIDISKQDSAQQAVNVIKNAINYVSGIRGDLGAVQNRLEHTQNNLSVMAENIQDAESTIRDTDVANEMMSYVKNNILIQSAQAMLAQANQIPQGVLQLLG